MSVYLVALTHPNEETLEKIDRVWGEDSYRITDTLIMLASDKGSSIDVITKQVGIDLEEGKPDGLVVDITKSGNGVLPATAVHWLKNARTV